MRGDTTIRFLYSGIFLVGIGILILAYQTSIDDVDLQPTQNKIQEAITETKGNELRMQLAVNDVQSTYTKVTKDNIDSISKQFIQEFHPTIAEQDIDVFSVNEVPYGGGVVRVANIIQRYKGVPIYGSLTKIVVKDDTTIIVLQDNIQSLTTVSVPSLMLTSDEAIARVYEELKGVEILVPRYSYAPTGLGIEKGNFVYWLTAHVDEGLSYEIVLDAQTGEVISLEDRTEYAGSISGNIIGQYHPDDGGNPAIDTPMKDMRVELQSPTGTLIDATYSDDLGNYNFANVAPGTYNVVSSFKSSTFYIFKDDTLVNTIGQPDSVFTQQVTVVDNQNSDVSWDWSNHVTSPDNGLFPESNVFYHLQDIFQKMIDVGFTPLIDANEPVLFRYEPQLGCEDTLPTASDLHYTPETTNMGSTGCQGVFKEYIIRHEMVHSALRISDFGYVRGSDIDWSVNFPYRNWLDADMTATMNEGLADYYTYQTTNLLGAPTTSATFLDYYHNIIYEVHQPGKILSSYGNVLGNLYGDDVILPIYTLATLMNPPTFQAFLDYLIFYDNQLYSGAHVNTICDFYYDSGFIFNEACWDSINAPYLEATLAFEDYTHPTNIQIDLDGKNINSYEIAYAPLNSAMYTVIATGSNSFPNAQEQHVENFATGSLPDGIYRLRFTATRTGFDDYVFYKLIHLTDGESPGFPHTMESLFYGQPYGVMNVDTDVDDELLYIKQGYFGSADPILRARDFETLSPAGSFDSTIAISTSLKPGFIFAGNIDSDSTGEIIVAQNSRVLKFDADGTNHQWENGGNGFAQGLTVEDLDNDGNLEVIVNYDISIGRFVIYGAPSGTELLVKNHGSRIGNGGIAVADLVGDAAKELVYGDSLGKVTALDPAGNTVWTYPVGSSTGVIRSMPAIGDINNDGLLEVIVNNDGQLQVLTSGGSLINQFGSTISPYSSPALADIDGDGDLELFVNTLTGLVGYHHTGTLVASFATIPELQFDHGFNRDCTYQYQSPVIGDIDGDGQQEIVSAADDMCPYVVAYESNGAFVSGWPKIVDYNEKFAMRTSMPETYSNPIIDDIDGDGQLEVFIGRQNKLHMWEMNVPYNSADHAWPYFGHDRYSTGNYDFDPALYDSVITPIPQGCIDDDGDGYGAFGSDFTMCTASQTLVDCDDADPAVNPVATELCDGIDNNCDGQTDEGYDVGQVCSSGLGVCSYNGIGICDGAQATQCLPIGSSPQQPSAEICDGLDNDCDGEVDENVCASACALTSISWGPLSSSEGATVQLFVTGSGCNAESLSVELYDEDAVNDDPIRTISAGTALSTTFSGDLATISWAITQQDLVAADDDTCLPGLCEYDNDVMEVYALAILDSDTSQILTSSILPVGPTNQPPVLDPIGNQQIDEGQSRIIPLSYSDPENTPIFCMASNLPTGASFDTGTCTFIWTPNFGDAGNYPDVLFKVTDSGFPPRNDYEFVTITVGDVNQPPVMDPIGNQQVEEGSLLSFVVSGSDPDGDGVSCSASNLPSGASFDTGTCTFSWTPNFDAAGNYPNIKFILLDDGVPVAQDIEFVTITVGDVNQPPVMDPIGNQQIDEGQLLSFVVSGSDPDGDALTCSVSNLPTGASFDTGTCTFTWTPVVGDAGVYSNVRFNLIDDGVPVEQDIEFVTITVGDVNQPPVLDPIGPQVVQEGELLSFTLGYSDPDGDAVACSASNLPTGATFDAVLCKFGWIPGFESAGNYPDVLFTITDDGVPVEQDSEAITITVGDVNRPPVMDPIGNQQIDEGQLLSFVVSGSDPDGDALTCSVSNLPTGASFDTGTCTFTWTPVVGDAGNYPDVAFTLADDGTPAEQDSEEIIITVGDVNQPPVLDPIGNKEVIAGTELSIIITGSDPEGNTVSCSVNNAPTGATFDDDACVFTWTPSVGSEGDYTDIEFIISDGGLPLETDSETITITVLPAVPVLTITQPINGEVITGETVDVTFTSENFAIGMVGETHLQIQIDIGGFIVTDLIQFYASQSEDTSTVYVNGEESDIIEGISSTSFRFTGVQPGTYTLTLIFANETNGTLSNPEAEQTITVTVEEITTQNSGSSSSSSSGESSSGGSSGGSSLGGSSSGGATCGDGTCSSSEDCTSCSADCGVCQSSSTWQTVISVTSAQLTAGFSSTAGASTQYLLSINGAQTYVGVTQVLANSVHFEFSNAGSEEVLNIGETTTIDFDSDGMPDIQIELIGISGQTASFSLQALSDSGSENETPDSSQAIDSIIDFFTNGIVLIVLGVVIVGVIILFVIMKSFSQPKSSTIVATGFGE